MTDELPPAPSISARDEDAVSHKSRQSIEHDAEVNRAREECGLGSVRMKKSALLFKRLRQDMAPPSESRLQAIL